MYTYTYLQFFNISRYCRHMPARFLSLGLSIIQFWPRTKLERLPAGIQHLASLSCLIVSVQ